MCKQILNNTGITMHVDEQCSLVKDTILRWLNQPQNVLFFLMASFDIVRPYPSSGVSKLPVHMDFSTKIQYGFTVSSSMSWLLLPLQKSAICTTPGSIWTG